jgi:rare lipoprotein A (peptidoglycan hydrolase)
MRGSLPDTATTIRGTATWYCSGTSACTRGYGPSDLVAAVDPRLGIARGTRIVVRSGGRSVTVTAVDVCACAGARVIDLTSGAFRRLAPLSRGIIPVTLTVRGRVAPAVVPPTSTGDEP